MTAALVFVKAAGRVHKTITNPNHIRLNHLGEIENFDEIIVEHPIRPSRLPGKFHHSFKIIFIEPEVRGDFILKNDLEFLRDKDVRKEFSKTLQEIDKDPEIEEAVIFDYSGHQNHFEFYSDAKIPYSEKFTLSFPQVAITRDMLDLDNLELFPIGYDLFSMKRVSSKLTPRENPLPQIKILTKILIKFLKMGFHRPEGNIDHSQISDWENYSDIDKTESTGWELNLTQPEMELFIIKYDLFPRVEDQKVIFKDHFFTNAQYRQVVTDTLARFLSRFMYKNKINRSKFETLANVYNYKTYKPLLEISNLPLSSTT